MKSEDEANDADNEHDTDENDTDNEHDTDENDTKDADDGEQEQEQEEHQYPGDENNYAAWEQQSEDGLDEAERNREADRQNDLYMKPRVITKVVIEEGFTPYGNRYQILDYRGAAESTIEIVIFDQKRRMSRDRRKSCRLR